MLRTTATHVVPLCLIAFCAAAFGCAPEPIPSALFTHPSAAAALRDIAGRSAISSGFPDICRARAARLLDPDFASDVDKQVQAGSRYAPNIEGTWRSTFCRTTTSQRYPDLSDCSGTVVWTEQGDGSITQLNEGASTSGSGDVAFIASIVSSTNGRPAAFIVQENYAVGAGCEQTLVNLLFVFPESDQGPTIDGINIVVDSTCPAPRWTCFYSENDRL